MGNGNRFTPIIFGRTHTAYAGRPFSPDEVARRLYYFLMSCIVMSGLIRVQLAVELVSSMHGDLKVRYYSCTVD